MRVVSGGRSGRVLVERSQCIAIHISEAAADTDADSSEQFAEAIGREQLELSEGWETVKHAVKHAETAGNWQELSDLLKVSETKIFWDIYVSKLEPSISHSFSQILRYRRSVVTTVGQRCFFVIWRFWCFVELFCFSHLSLSLSLSLSLLWYFQSIFNSG